MLKKAFIIYIIALSILIAGNSLLLYFNIIELINLPKMNELFVIGAFCFGFGCLYALLLIKRIFHKFYRIAAKLESDANDSEIGSWLVSEKKAYKTLKVMLVVLFLLAAIFQGISLII